MANVKTIIKKLINAGYKEDKLMMMTEKEIREAYKTFKEEVTMKNHANEVETINSETTVEVEKEETTMKKNNNTTATNNSTNNKEVITMTNEMIKEMKKLARNYDAFTHCIEDYRQKEEAEKRNKILAVKFVEVANKMGINATVNDLYEIISNDSDSFDEAIETYIKSHEVRVVSATLTQENGELTFVELSTEQKIQISAVLDAQLQDVNYSSWFEEENGIFKLYTAWVDEDPTVEEYYFDDNNKLIKVEVEKEESTMKNNTNTTATNNNATAVKEEITMKEMRGTDIFFEFKEEEFSLVETWADAWVDYNTEENEKLIKEVTNMRYPLALQAAKIAVKNIDSKETMSYRVLSEDRKFWCDCGLGNANTIIVKVACALEGDNPRIKNGYGCIHDFRATAKEEIKMNTVTETTKTETEEIVMTRTIEEIINDALNIKSFRDERYVSNKILIAEYKKLTGETIRARRAIIIAKLQEHVKEEPETIVAGDFCRDNAPVEIIEEPTVELNQEMAAKILERVIRQADTNKAHNFISNWMLTSAISEVLFGVPLKEKRNGEVIEHWKSFSKEQNKMLAFIHREFVCKSGLVAKRKDGTIVGYVIPSKILIWGRHKYLNKACIYKFVDKHGKALAEYMVSINGIKDTATGKMIPLTADDYNTLDTKCVFIR